MGKFKKSFSIFISLIMLIGVICGIAVVSNANDDAQNSVSLTVGENIISHYYLDAEAYESKGASKFRYSYNNGNTQERIEIISDIETFDGNKNENGKVQIDVAQAAAQIAEPITVEILNESDETLETVTYTAKEYCDNVIGMEEGTLLSYTSHPAELKKLCKSIIAYSKSAQGVFSGYMAKEGSVAVTDDYSSDLNLAEASYDYSSYSKTNGNIIFKSVSFMCESTAKMRFYFIPLNANDSTDYGNPVVSSPFESSWSKGVDPDGKYNLFIQINDIAPADFDKQIVIEYAGATIRMSVLEYAGVVIANSGTSAELKVLGKSLIRYNESAKTFFSAPATVYVPAKASTCTQAGWTAHYELGGKSYSDAYATEETDASLPLLAHSYGEYAQSKAPDCTEAGTEIRTCTVCGAEDSREIAALGHSYSAAVTAPTCTAQGYTTYTCTRCSNSYTDNYTDAPGHSWNSGEITTAAGCTSTGVKTYTCTVCASTRTEDVPATGHTEVTDAAVAPTCTETGLTQGKHCSVCNTVLVAQQTVPATGHTEVTDAAVAPTCTETGLTQGKHCSVCNTVLTAQTTVNALGHSWNDGVITTAASCTSKGVKTYTCTRCETQKTEDIAALGHSYSAVVTAPTCTAQGYTSYTCSRCGDTYDSDYQAALGHSYGAWTVTTAATLSANGSETRTCANDSSHKETRTVQSFSCKLTNRSSYLYRVGNGNNIKLGTLFDSASGADISNVSVAVTKISGGVTSTYTANASDWRESTVRFSNEGVVSLAFKHGGTTVETLKLEVITGKNVTVYSDLSSNLGGINILLGDIALSSGANPTISGTVYGNGFTIDASAGLRTKTGTIVLSNGKLDNIVINGKTESSYVDSFGSTGYSSTVCSEGDGSVITNCYITGGQSPLRINSVATVKNTVAVGGVFANVDVRGGELTAENLTTVNTQNGLGIVVSNGAGSATKITINGTLTQHDFISENATMSNDNAKTLKNSMFGSSFSKYQFTSDGTKYINTGIISMSPNVDGENITDNRTDKQNYSGSAASFMGQSGYVYTMENTDSSLLETSYTEPAYTPGTQKPYEPSFTWGVPGSINVPAGGDEHCYKDSSGIFQIQFTTGSSKTVDASALPVIKKYGTYTCTPTITCKDKNGSDVAVTNGNVTFNAAGTYTLYYSYTDTNVYDKTGSLTNNEAYTKTIKVNVNVKKASKTATITSTADTGTIAWGKAGSTFDPDYNPCIPFLDGLTITDYDVNGNAYTVLDGSNQASFISSLAGVSVSSTTVTMTLANGTKLVVKGPAVDGSVQIKSNSNKLYYCDSTADNNPAAFTKSFAKNSYTYTGENGVAVSYGTARSFTSTTSTSTIATYSSMSTPWTSNKFLMYDAQGGEVTPTYASASPATLPTPVREGYTFKNWNTKADGTGTASNAGTSKTFSSTTTLYAIWAENVTVSFNANGGSEAEDVSNGAGMSSTLPTSAKEGFWLEGWYTEKNEGTKIGNAGASFTLPESNTTYYAHWSPEYTVTYNANGGTVETASATYKGTALTLAAPTNGSKTFEGWYTAAEGGTLIGAAGDSYVPTVNITLFAQWSDNILVTFDGNGGSAGTNSATYDNVNPITLPTATFAGHSFNGWYDASSGGYKIGDTGASYVPTEPVTLYAQWTAYTVTYNANSGSVSPASASAGSDGTVTLPTPTRTGYTFGGWYDAQSGGTKIGDGGASYTPTANITLYAHWSVNSYKVTITTSNSSTVLTNNATGTTISNNASVAYDTVVKVVLSYTQSNSLTFTIKQGSTNVTRYSDEACTSGTTSTAAGTYYFKMPAGDVTINSSSASGSSCIAPETLVTLANGTQKRADELTMDDDILVWNFETGKYDSARFIFIDVDPEDTYNVVNLEFSDGTSTKLISEHGYFDVDEGKYVYITEENYRDYIGDSFIKLDSIENNTWTSVELVDSYITQEVTIPFGPTTQGGFCFYVDGLLSMPGGVEGMFNIFDVDTEAMTYDFEALQRDIETYGLYTYEDFEGIIPEDVFEMCGGAYLKIAIGKGLITWERIVEIAERYTPYFAQYN